jgi:glyoxylase-like metal-dependent hydrolase (beta-lactamase superfamily II)
VVKVATSEGQVLLASDAVHYYEEYASRMPFAIVSDVVRMYEVYEEISAMISSGEIAQFIPGHDSQTLDRYASVSGELSHLVSRIGHVE